MALSRYDLSCCRDVKHKTNNQINKRKQKTLNFSMMTYGITSTVMGSESILLNRKPIVGSRDQKKETRHCRIRRDQIDQIKTKIDSSKKFPHN